MRNETKKSLIFSCAIALSALLYSIVELGTKRQLKKPTTEEVSIGRLAQVEQKDSEKLLKSKAPLMGQEKNKNIETNSSANEALPAHNQRTLEEKRTYYSSTFSEIELEEKVAGLDREMEPLITEVNAVAASGAPEANALRAQLALLMQERNAAGLALADTKIRKLRHELAEDRL